MSASSQVNTQPVDTEQNTKLCALYDTSGGFIFVSMGCNPCQLAADSEAVQPHSPLDFLKIAETVAGLPAVLPEHFHTLLGNTSHMSLLAWRR